MKFCRIELTNNCNLRCAMCHQSVCMSRERGFMDYDLFVEIARQLGERFPRLNVAFHISGEPLLHPKVFDCIRTVGENGLRSRLVTNGTLLTAETSKKIIESELHQISFSFEGYGKDVYESYRVGANYEKTLEAIDSFLVTNNQSGHPVCTELVYVDLPKVDEKTKSTFERDMQGRFDRLNRNKYFDWLGVVDRNKFDRKRYSVCPVLSTDLNVLWTGEVIPCCMDSDGQMIIGDFRTMRLNEVLSSPARREMQAKFRCGKISGLPCEQCHIPWQ